MDRMDDIIRNILYFQIEYFPHWKENVDMFYSNAIAGECGELCNLTKKKEGGGTHYQNWKEIEENINEELADIMIYCIIMYLKKGINPLSMIEDKMEINWSRMRNRNINVVPKETPKDWWNR
jgi:NTP pyrophosphatase (non-canonical NTP hydrolase)